MPRESGAFFFEARPKLVWASAEKKNARRVGVGIELIEPPPIRITAGNPPSTANHEMPRKAGHFSLRQSTRTYFYITSDTSPSNGHAEFLFLFRLLFFMPF
jgi:hypothetical protein